MCSDLKDWEAVFGNADTLVSGIKIQKLALQKLQNGCMKRSYSALSDRGMPQYLHNMALSCRGDDTSRLKGLADTHRFLFVLF